MPSSPNDVIPSRYRSRGFTRCVLAIAAFGCLPVFIAVVSIALFQVKRIKDGYEFPAWVNVLTLLFILSWLMMVIAYIWLGHRIRRSPSFDPAERIALGGVMAFFVAGQIALFIWRW